MPFLLFGPDCGILPRPKKCPPDTFCTSLRTGVGLSNPALKKKNRTIPKGDGSAFGPDCGIRTHGLLNPNGKIRFFASKIAVFFRFITKTELFNNVNSDDSDYYFSGSGQICGQKSKPPA